MKWTSLFVFFVIFIGMPKANLSMQPTSIASLNSSFMQAEQEFQQNPLALHDACRKGDFSAVKRLIVLPEKINVQDKNGWTPLHLATLYNKNTEILELLLSSGAHIHIQNKYGRTPLHLAARVNKFQNLKSLLFYAHHIPSEWQAPVDTVPRKIVSLKNICLNCLAYKNLQDEHIKKFLPDDLWQEIVATPENDKKLRYMKYLLTLKDIEGKAVRHSAETHDSFITFIDRVLDATTLGDLKELGYTQKV